MLSVQRHLFERDGVNVHGAFRDVRRTGHGLCGDALPVGPRCVLQPNGILQPAERYGMASRREERFGAGVSCASANCPSTPNDECSNAYAIPCDRPSYYEPQRSMKTTLTLHESNRSAV